MSRLPADVDALLRRLHAQRASLPETGTTAYRAAHLTETESLFTLERAGSVGILSLYRELGDADEARLACACGEALELESVYLKRRPVEARHVANTDREVLAPSTPAWGRAVEEVTVLERGVPFLIRPGGDLSVGLFTDMRPAREWVRANARESVLNTFAYTCGFGLMARLGGAQQVKNLDASRKVLAWGQENYRLSGLPHPDEDFVFGDVFDWLARFAKRGVKFEQVILDPPSFARGKSGSWRAEKDYATLAASAARVVEAGGQLIAAVNHHGVAAAAFERMVRAGLDSVNRRSRIIARLGAGPDYPRATHLKVLVVQLDLT